MLDKPIPKLDRNACLRNLKKAWDERRLVLFLGAGVSIPHGVPNWNDLVLQLLLEETGTVRDYPAHYRSALGEWMSEQFEFTPVALSREFKNRLLERKGAALLQEKYLNRISRALYPKQLTQPQPTHDSLAAIADLIERSGRERRIPAVITSNFDDLLERKLDLRKVPYETIYNATRRTGKGLPILHVHGYLPHGKPAPKQEIVFAEDEYHRLTYSFFHWALAELVGYMRNSTILFIGFSMNDPNIRRLLDATNDGVVSHYTFRKAYKPTALQTVEASAQIIKRAKELNQTAHVKEPNVVIGEIQVMLDKAQAYDESMLAQMGVGTIRIHGFDEIPTLLREIGGIGPSGRGNGKRTGRKPAAINPGRAASRASTPSRSRRTRPRGTASARRSGAP